MTITVSSADDIRTRVLNYNAQWLRTEGTEADRVEMMAALLDGVPTRTITVSHAGQGYTRYLITITEGLQLGDGFYAAEDPRVSECRRRDDRQDMAKVAERFFGQNLPEGWELRIIRHD